MLYLIVGAGQLTYSSETKAPVTLIRMSIELQDKALTGCDSDLVVVVDCQIPADELIVHDL